jgi:DNA-binding transcriptional MerR regulator
MPDEERYTLTELADLAGVTPRTVRYYIGQGLLPSVGQSGPGAKYGDDHLARLRLIRRLQREHLPLGEIRRRLDGLDDAEIAGLAGSEAPAAPPDSALEYLATILGGPQPNATPDPAAAATVSFRRIPPAPAAPTPAPRGEPMPHRASESPEVFQSDAPLVLAERIGDSYGPTVATVPAAPATQAHDRSQWERIALTPDVELHIRRPLTRSLNKAVDRLITIARELLQEDPS